MQLPNIAIVTDSASDVSKECAEMDNIVVVSLHIHYMMPGQKR